MRANATISCCACTLAALDDALADAQVVPGMQAVIVANDGLTVRRRFFNGSTGDSAYNIYSATTSVMSALIGIAIEQRILAGVDQPLSDLLGSMIDSLNEQWGRVTVENLLTMSAGHNVDAASITRLVVEELIPAVM